MASCASVFGPAPSRNAPQGLAWCWQGNRRVRLPRPIRHPARAPQPQQHACSLKRWQQQSKAELGAGITSRRELTWHEKRLLSRQKGARAWQVEAETLAAASADGHVEVYKLVTPLSIYKPTNCKSGVGGAKVGLGTMYPEDLEHHAVLLSVASQSLFLVLDFAAVNPLSPETALALTSGQTVPGELREKTMGTVPPEHTAGGKQCIYVGQAKRADALNAAVEFHRGYPNKELNLLTHDCRTYASSLIDFLLFN